MSQLCGSGWSRRSKVTSAPAELDEAASNAAPDTAAATRHFDATPRMSRRPAEIRLISFPPNSRHRWHVAAPLSKASIVRLTQAMNVIQCEARASHRPFCRPKILPTYFTDTGNARDDLR